MLQIGDFCCYQFAIIVQISQLGMANQMIGYKGAVLQQDWLHFHLWWVGFAHFNLKSLKLAGKRLCPIKSYLRLHWAWFEHIHVQQTVRFLQILNAVCNKSENRHTHNTTWCKLATLDLNKVMWAVGKTAAASQWLLTFCTRLWLQNIKTYIYCLFNHCKE